MQIGAVPQHAGLPQQGTLPADGIWPQPSPATMHGGLHQQAFAGMGVAGSGIPFQPGMGAHEMLTTRPPLYAGLQPHGPMSSAYNVPRPCADLPHGLHGGCGPLPHQAPHGGCGVLPHQAPLGGCGPLPHQVPSAVFQQASNGMTGNVNSGTGQASGSGGNSPQAGTSPPGVNPPPMSSPDRHGPRAPQADPWSQYRPTDAVTNAREFSQRLREERPGFKPVTSAFEAMGKAMPSSSTTAHGASVTNEQLLAKLVDAVSGDRKLPIPTWDGTPSGLRGWLRQLSFWETESNLPREKWGVRLFQSLSGEARKIAETVSTDVLLTADGYSAVLTALVNKFQP